MLAVSPLQSLPIGRKTEKDLAPDDHGKPSLCHTCGLADSLSFILPFAAQKILFS